MTDQPHEPSRTATEAGRITPVTDGSLREAAGILMRAGLVALPTETVYGLAADATNGEAVARIYAAKGRPRFNPLICHIADRAMADTLAALPPLAGLLATAFWPGPLTLVAPRRADCPVSELATAGLDTIALRMPDHPAALALIRTVGRPLAAPSANPSEALSPTTAAHVAAGLGASVELILDGGPSRAGVESTIIMVDQHRLFLLRPGALPREAIEDAAGARLESPPVSDAAIRAPGQLRRHYAPRADVRLNATGTEEGEAYLAFGAEPPCPGPLLNLSQRADLIEAASNLFSMLRELDLRSSRIAVAPIPDIGIGEAINDRLQRAAARSEKVGV